MIADRSTRRGFLAGAAGLGLVLAGCGDDESSPSATPTASTRFPVRVPHKFGATEVAAAPSRVAAYGGGDVDTLLALGIVPVLVPNIDPRWKDLGGVGPWARARLKGAKPVVAANDELQFERIAKVRPDLITTVEFDLKRSDYDKLSALAPTIPPPKGFAPWTVPWDRMAIQVGTGAGQRDKATRLVAQARASIAAAGRANPAFGRSRALHISPDDDGGVYVFAPGDVRTRFLKGLGFTQPAEIEKLFGDQFYAQISAERLDLLDSADVLVLDAARGPQTRALKASRTFKALKAKVITVDDPDLSIALSYSSLLSLPYQLRALVPQLRDALAA